MTLAFLIGVWVVPALLMLAWFLWERRKPVTDLDRRLDRLDRELDDREKPPRGSVQARVDQARRDALNGLGRDADELWRDEPAHGIRHTPGGWRN